MCAHTSGNTCGDKFVATMSFKVYLFFVTCAFLIGVSSADIFGDFFKWDLVSAFTGGDEEDEKQAKQDDDGSASTCDCHGPKCNCCVDFNISNVIDFGGPGCVIMKYLSESEGISLNVSYGERVLHSQKIVDEKKQGACMPLLSDFAQFCARFSGLNKVDDGMTGCLNFEPTVLGEATAQYFVGCFRMSPDRMILDDSLNNSTETESESQEDVETSSKKPDEENQTFLEAVNQSAQEGIEFFSSLLGINVGGKKKKTPATEKPETTSESSSRKLGKEVPYLSKLKLN